LLADLIFQFTPLREGRLTGSAPVFNAFYFNSRPSARGDKTGLSRYIFLSISIHAPPRGATVHFSFGTFSTQISIHAPPRGATPLLFSILASVSISIHAPPRGATESNFRAIM